jgi:tRNA A-37 threonylcarbamoyl transferase component Bud32
MKVGRDDERAAVADALPGYELGAILGRGAFAVVYAARHLRLERDVAIKRLSPELLADADAHERFGAEARLLASLDHPHIVRVHDYVEDGEVCALVMERLRGGTLADRLRFGMLPRGRACAVALAALYGLEHAHRHDVLHRDIKPENLLFGEHDLVKVSDFGIAKVVGARGSRMTATATMLGTPAFMAPEQVSRAAGPLSTATDVWAAGAVLYELLAGEPPFVASAELGDSLLARLNDDPRPLRALAADVPEDLADVVMTALARDPARRYPTAGAFAAALEPVGERAAAPGGLKASGIPLHRVDPIAASAAPMLVQPPAQEPGGGGRRPRRRTLLGAGGVAVIAAAVAIVLALSGGDGPARAQPPAPPAGWPATLSLGYNDQVGGSGGSARVLGKGGSAQGFFLGDAAARKDWSQDHVNTPARFVRDTQRHGLLPYLVYIQLPAIGQKDGAFAKAPGIRRTLVDPRLMRIYWRNVRAFLRSVGSTHRVAAISVEDASVASFIEQDVGFSSGQAADVPSRVSQTGLPELRGLQDNFAGFFQAWSRLRDRYAPKALLGYAVDDWATNVDLARDAPATPAVVAAGRQLAEFYLSAVQNEFDFMALGTVGGSGGEEGQEPNPNDVYSASERGHVVDLVAEFVRVSRTPVVLEGVPLGNTASKTISDKPFHWHDRWVQWLLGSARFSGLRRLRDAGVIGVQFGVNGGANETCPCDAAKDGVTNAGAHGTPSTSRDDDGGYFTARVAALRRAGGLPLGSSPDH